GPRPGQRPLRRGRAGVRENPRRLGGLAHITARGRIPRLVTTPSTEETRHHERSPHPEPRRRIRSGPYASPARSGLPARCPAPSARRAEEARGKGLGIVSLVASLSTFIGFNVVGPVIGIITGHMARSRSKADGRADNEMGRWGLILGIVFLALLAFGWMLGISAGIVGGMVSLLGA